MKSVVPFSLGLLSLAVSSSLYAQSADYQLEPIVVTASRFPAPADATPTNVTVISREQIEQSGAQNVAELLQQQAGINTRSTDGTPNQSIDMRGFGMTGSQNVVVLLDDVRLNENELAPARLSAIPLEMVERIEIMRGAGAVLYGAGATGGVIRVVTRAAQKESGGYVQAGIGSYNGYALRGGLNGSVGTAAVRLDLSTYDSDNYRKNNGVHQDSLLLSGSLPAGDSTLTLKVGAEAQKLRLPSYRQVDPSTGVDQLVTDRRGTSTPNDWSMLDSQFVLLGWNKPLGKGELQIDVAQREKQQEAFLELFGTPTGVKGDSSQLQLNPRYRLPYRAAEGAHTVIIGADFADWDYASSRYGFSTANILASQQNQALYADHLSTWGGTTVSMGARYERVEQQASDTTNPAAYASGSQVREVNAWELGVKQRLGAWSVFGKLGRSYRLPVIDELYNQFGGPVFDSLVTMLKPQTSDDRELGVGYQFDRGAARLTWYQMELDNELHYNPLTFQNMNLSPTRREGVELEGKWNPSAAWQLFANYTYADASFVSGTYGGVDVSGNRVPLVPRQSASAGFSWQPGGGHQLSLLANHVGNQLFDNDQTNDFGKAIPSYTTVDAKWQYQTGSWKYALAVNNLFDEKYYTYAVRSTATPGKFNAYPMPERNVWLTAEYRFK